MLKRVAINIVLLFLSLMKLSETTVFDETLIRTRRQLIFPNSTLVQFNAGIGTPTPAKLVNLNWAFQANFQLPWNRTQIPTDILGAYSGYEGESRKKRDVDTDFGLEDRDGGYENDAQLYHFYQYVEDMLNSSGHNGTACVLHTLCQIAEEPLHVDDEEDILHEIASFVLNPTNDNSPLKEKDERRPYIEAFHRGQAGEGCDVYNCTFHLINLFSKPHPMD